MQKLIVNIQHFKTIGLLAICLLFFHSATWPTNAHTADSSGCQIPQDIQGVSVLLHPSHATITPGSWVKDLETIHVKCNNRVGISDTSDLFCFNGHFNSNFPSCSATPTPTPELPTPVYSAVGAGCQIPPDSQDVSVTLHPFNNTVPPGSWVKDLETVHVKCNNLIATSGASSLFCYNGQFNSNFPSCSVTTTPTPVQIVYGAACQVPPDIQDVSLKLLPLNRSISPGSWVDDSDTIVVQCTNRTAISGATPLFCDNGQFISKFPSCSATPTPATELATPSEDAIGDGCQIPPDIKDITIVIHPTHNVILPGTWVKDLETIHVQCNSETGISGAGSLVCFNGQFNTKFPSCSDYCDGNLLKGISTIYQFREGHYFYQMQCSKKILPYTELEVFCAPGYKRSSGNERQRIRCLANGMFDVEREKCDMECGLAQPSYVAPRRKRSTVDPNQIPWHVSIYELVKNEYVLICTGSIISPTLIISAAHCFWDYQRQSRDRIENYQFIPGKYKRKYNSLADDLPLIVEAETIQISEIFRGQINGYDGNVALIKLKEPLIFNDKISAVCMLYNEDALSGYDEPDILGTITGYAENNTIEQVPATGQSCSEKVEGLSDDKFCLSVENHNAICIGGGVGFVVEEEDVNYLRGIYSYRTSNGDVLATNVRHIKDDLREKIKRQLQEDTLLY